MPVIQHNKPKHLNLIIIGVVFIALCAAGTYLYQNWSVWLQTSVAWQRQLNLLLSELLQSTQRDPLQAGSLLVAVSFLYGLLHALGPGHGKLIISTYIATHPTRLKQSVILSLLASLLQGAVAIVLVSAVLVVFQLSTRHLNMVSLYSEKLSYGFVVLLGALCCYKAFHQWRKARNKRTASVLHIQRLLPLNSTSISAIKTPPKMAPLCQCGHQHVVSSQQLQASLRTQAILVLSMGLRPCSGALLVLLFSYVIGVYTWGIFAALAMAMGTAFTISLIALFVYFMRHHAMRLTKTQGISFSPYWRALLYLCTGLIFILLGVLMYQSVMLTETASPLLSPRIR